MTFAEALRVLIVHAARNVGGTGCGIRPPITEEDRREVAQAVQKVWPKAFRYEFTDSEAFNMGLPYPEEKERTE